MSTSTAVRPREPTTLHSAGEALLAAAVAAFCWYRYGPLGPRFQADSAVIGAMTLRPLTRESLYFWGQDRLGALIPLLARWPVRAFHLDAATTVQLLSYLGAAVMAWALIHLLSTWPWKIALAYALAFCSLDLAGWMLDPSQPGPVGGMLAALQLLAFLRAWSRPSTSAIALTAFLAGLTLWAAESCILLLPAELGVALVLARRARLAGSPALSPRILAALVGLLPPLLLIALGKHFSYRVAESYVPIGLGDGMRVAWRLRRQFTALSPLLRVGLYPISIALALCATRAFWRWAQEASEKLPTWALLGWAPLLCFLVTSDMDWFRANYYAPRYLAFGVILAVVASCLLLESLSLNWGTGRTPRALGALGAAALTLGTVASAPSSDRSQAATSQQWRAKTALALEAGCLGLIGDYWQSYPYLTLSQGWILATPNDKAYVRSKPLAREAVRQSVVCVLPWEAPLDRCPAELTQFEARLTLRDRYEGKVGDEVVTFCRYNSSLASELN